MTGYFITFEGIEGCGKTTQIRLLAQHMERLGYRVLLTREPGGCAIADQIRAILLDAQNKTMTPTAELLLYAAARSQHVHEVIRPAMESGQVVLCDRYTDATIAYQGDGRGLELSTIQYLNVLASGGLKPRSTILLDCPVDTGLKRAFDRINDTPGTREERFELESVRFHQKVRDGYLKLAGNEPERFIVIDGSKDIETTRAAISEAILAKMATR